MIKFILLTILTGSIISCATVQKTDNEVKKIRKYWPALPEKPRYQYIMSIYSSSDFIKKNKNDLFREAIVGKTMPQYIVKRPLDITAGDGLLYLIDSDTPVIHVIDLVRRRYFKFGYRFEGKLVNPVGICTDQNGLVYVADRGRNSIIIYDSYGLFQSVINLKGVTTQLAGITTDPNGNFVYVVDRGGIDSHRHQII